MNSTIRLKLAFSALTLASNVVLASEVKIFNLPLGGKIDYPMLRCKTDRKTAKLCWVDKPYVDKTGWKSGMAELPEDGLPQWALNTTATVNLDNNSVLEKIETKIYSSSEATQREVVNSISSRFGPPTSGPAAKDGIFFADWKRPELSIRFMCSEGKYCLATFSSKQREEQLAKEKAARELKDAARPASP